MDSGTLALLIPIVALSIPVAAIVMSGLSKIWKMRLEEARLRAGQSMVGDGEFEQLRAEVDQLKTELAEVHERLDFTERILAKNADRERLPGAS
ncbi:MAG TPA: hypothetical protein VEI47_08530 [Gemmatimonadales bacterium]|nr:hypothetical protein [Gemmatimonadales bacterium]